MAILAIAGRMNSGKDTVGKIIQYLTHTKNNRMSFESFCLLEERWYNYDDFEIKKFAGKLKQMVCILLGCTMEQLEDREFKEKELGEKWDKLKVVFSDGFDENTMIVETNFDFSTFKDAKGRIAYIHSKEVIKLTPRKILQLLGTECVSTIIHSNAWTNALFIDYKPYLGDMKLVYPNWIITDLRFPNELQAIKDRGGITIRVNRSLLGKLQPIERGNYKIPNAYHISETALDAATFDYTIDNNGTIKELIEKVKHILIKEKII
jgi:hypothetical protein